MSGAVHVTELVRGLALMVAGYNLLVIPILVYKRTAGERRWVVEVAFAAGFEMILFGRVMQAIVHWGEPLLWWGAPLTLVGGVLLALSAWLVLRR